MDGGAGKKLWSAVACSNNGKLAASAGVYGKPEYVYFSRDFGLTWERQDAAGAHVWTSLALS